METIQDVRDFKAFLKSNKEKIQTSTVNASDISIHDEWMREDKWDEIYKKEGKNNGGVQDWRSVVDTFSI